MRIIVLLVLAVLLGSLSAQSQIFEYERQIAPTPEVSNFIRNNFSESNLFRGTPNISIPIHKIELNGFDMDISLGYNYDGFKTNEIASQVGMGWNINAGGMVTRVVKGKPDDVYGGLNLIYNEIGIVDPYLNPQAYSDWRESFSHNPYFMRKFINEEWDGIPDEYILSIGNLSFSFYSMNGTDFIQDPYSAVKIIRNPIVDGNFTTNTWKIVDESGNQYFFGKLNLSDEFGEANSQTFVCDDHEYTYTSTWFIGKIITRLGEEIFFNYDGYTTNSENHKTFTELYTTSLIPECPPRYIETTTTVNEINYRLTSIETPKEKILFYNTTEREDVDIHDYSKQLDSIKIYSICNSLVFESNPFKKYIFNYEYLGYRLFLRSLVESGNSQVDSRKHSFTYLNETESGTPLYTSFSIDHWGYLNGAGNNNLIPATVEGSPWDQYFQHAFANREPHPEKSLFGLIKSITLPTGGEVEYQYEPHDYGAISHIANSTIANEAMVVYDEELPVSASVPTETGANSFSLKIILDTEQELVLSYNINSHGYPATLEGGVVRLKKLGSTLFEIGQNDIVGKHAITLEPGAYFLEAQIFDAHFTASISTTIKKAKRDSDGNIVYTLNKPAGGHRLKRVIERDNGVIKSSKRFYYKLESEDNRSSGVLFKYPNYETTKKSYNIRYLRVNPFAPAGPSVVTLDDELYQVRSGISNVAITTGGSHIGYKEVMVKQEGLGADSIGKSVYKFNYYSDIFIPKIAQTITRSYLRGLLNEKILYSASGDKVVYREKNDWDIRLGVNSPIGKGIAGIFLCEYDHDGLLNDSTDTFVYPVFGEISSNWVKLKSTSRTTYFDSDSLYEKEEYTYTNYLHNQPSLQEKESSDGKRTGRRTFFPPDYSPGGIVSSMLSRNILNAPIETIDYVQQPNEEKQVTDGMVIQYTLQNNAILMDKVYKSDLVAPVPFDSFTFSINAGSFNVTSIDESYGDTPITWFDAYNSSNRLIQVHNRGNYTVSYQWGYNQTLPTAKASNAPAGSWFHESFEELTGWDNNLTAYDETRKQGGNYSGRIDKPTTGELYSHCTQWLTTNLSAPTRYRYSGWIYSNGPSADIYLFMKKAGEANYYSYVDHVTATTVGQWVYLEKEFAVPADVKLLNIRVDNNGGGSVWFDDIRLAPADAQVESYTWKPGVGVTSVMDPNGRSKHFEFDELGRLVLVHDDKNRVLDTYKYHFIEPQQ